MSNLPGILLIFHGFIIALFFLLLSSLTSGVTRAISLSLAVLALLYQGACSMTAEGIGRATGGGGDPSLIKFTMVGIFIGLVWAVGIVAIWPRKRKPVYCPSCNVALYEDPWNCPNCGWSGAKPPPKPPVRG